MEAIWGLISGIFWLAVFVGAIALVIFLTTYNKLRRLSEEVQKRYSNLGASYKKMVDVLNKLGDAVKRFEGYEGLVVTQVSQDYTAAALNTAYHQSGAIMASLQNAAQRFPDLKADAQYQRHMDAIATCHVDIETRTREYNDAVSDYRRVRLSFPTVLYAGLIGYPKGEYIRFEGADVSGISPVSSFAADDERLERLISAAGTKVAGATRSLAGHAGEAGKVLAGQAAHAGKALAEKIRENATTKYFYLVPGAVPKGPATLEEIRDLVSRGMIPEDTLLAEAGREDWAPIPPVETERSDFIRSA